MKIDTLREVRQGHRENISARLEEIEAAVDNPVQFNVLFKTICRKQELVKDLDEKILALTEYDNIREEMKEADNFGVRLELTLSQLQVTHENSQTVPTTSDTGTTEPEMPQPILITDDTNVNHNSMNIQTGTPLVTSNNAPLPSVSRVQRLPKLSLPGFSGDLLQWQNFWDSYETSVHLNPDLTDVEKFNYLRSLLVGDAAKTISGFSLTNANYVRAIELLTERFGKKHRIVQSHMHALLQLPAPSKHLSSLREYYDSLEVYVRGLEALGEDQQNYGSLLITNILSKLPAEVRQNITRQNGNDDWIIGDLRRALHKEITILESGQPIPVPEPTPTASFYTGSRQTPIPRAPQRFDDRPSNTLTANTRKSTQPLCVFCEQRHSSTDCTKFVTKKARIEKVKHKQLCFNCLGPHKVTACKSIHRCRHCKKKHHTSICDTPTNQNPITQNPALDPNSREFLPSTNNAQSMPSQIARANTNILHSTTHQRSNVLLKTAVAKVCSSQSSTYANILFDEGAQRSFVTETLADELQLERTGSDIVNLALFGATTSSIRRLDTAIIYLVTDSGEKVAIEALIVPNIAVPLRNMSPRVNSLPYLQGLKLAHPISTDTNFDITLLIGADFYWDIVENRVVRGKGPTAVSSKIGYLLSGPIPSPDTEVHDNHVLNILTATPAIEEIERFWKLESIGITPEEDDTPAETCLTEYQDRCIEYHGDHYSAKLPWKENHDPLPSNYMIAKRRTENLVRRISKDEKIFREYGKIIDDQERRGFIEKVDARETDIPRSDVHYIPHHGVEKDSATTPVRIVFDCSCRQAKGYPSLNDCLMSTPPQLNNLASILVRFRLNRFAITTDIEKAFLHVQLDEQDRDYTRFLWLSNPRDPNSPLTTYRFKSVLFGATCSPFILNATLLKHLQIHKDKPLSPIVARDLYVDNILSSFETETATLSFFRDTRALMGSASFNLRSWNSNSEKLRELAATQNILDDNTVSKVLGMLWNAQDDEMMLQHKPIPINSVVTKREILHHISKIYDPLGLVLPVTIAAKIFMQNLWKAKLEWDTVVPEPLNQTWTKLAQDMNNTNVTFPRYYFHSNQHTFDSNKPTLSLHVFVDASVSAYGAVTYISNGKQSSLVIAKSRVAPVKKLTMPRLELMSAVLGSRLTKHVEEAIEVSQTYFWTDSQIVLHWLESRKPIARFIQNRVKEIRQVTGDRKWRYCPTRENPADLVTRGITSQQYKDSDLWKYGPTWLNEPDNWPVWNVPEVVMLTTDDADDIATPTQSMTTTDSLGLHKLVDSEKYSRYMKLLRVTAYVLRFVANCRSATLKQTSHLTPNELHRAEVAWLTSCQTTEYRQEIENLKSNKPRLPLVRQLRLFLDTDGLIRCGGRIHNAPLSQDTKFPILLPKKHPITRHIVIQAHERQLHAGINATITELRQRYWIPSIRQYVRSILRKCVTCRKVNGRPYVSPDPPPLPSNRVADTPPFTVTGVDFTGALYVKTNTGSESKAYVCLFTCASSRAVHLELVQDLTEETFMHAFRRFCSRRSVPAKMISDNATTYLAAANHIQKIFQSPNVQEQLTQQGTVWQFIPKRAPWWGGWWERLIGLTKTAIKKVLGRAQVTYQILLTVVTEVEAILNDRPITYVASGLDDPEPLTPSHLLCGRRLTSLPYQDVSSEDTISPGTSSYSSLTKRVRIQTKLIEDFKSRWKHEYLTGLREHHKTTGQNKQTIEVGDVVHIHNETPRCTWKLAVVDELIRGNDERVRSAKVRTANGVTNRPIVKLYPLEVKSDVPSDVP